MNTGPLYKVTVRVSYPDKKTLDKNGNLVPVAFLQTVRAIPEEPTKAKRRARKVLRKMFPSARLRVRRCVRDRKAESSRFLNPHTLPTDV